MSVSEKGNKFLENYTQNLLKDCVGKKNSKTHSDDDFDYINEQNSESFKEIQAELEKLSKPRDKNKSLNQPDPDSIDAKNEQDKEQFEEISKMLDDYSRPISLKKVLAESLKCEESLDLGDVRANFFKKYIVMN